MEMQPIQLGPLRRQPTLESQQSGHHHPQPNTQSQYRSLYSPISARLQRGTDNFQETSDVDVALSKAAMQRTGGSRFLKEYAQMSHRSNVPLGSIFDLFVRERLETSTCWFLGHWLC